MPHFQTQKNGRGDGWSNTRVIRIERSVQRGGIRRWRFIGDGPHRANGVGILAPVTERRCHRVPGFGADAFGKARTVDWVRVVHASAGDGMWAHIFRSPVGGSARDNP